MSDTITKIAVDGCKIAMTLTHSNVNCSEFVPMMAKEWIQNLVDLVNKDRICDELLGFCSKPHIEAIDLK